MTCLKSIRTSTVAVLKAANTAAGGNVYNTPVHNLPTDRCPAICVWADNEEMTSFGTTEVAFKTQADLEITCFVVSGDDFADELEDLLTEVKQALFTSDALLDLFEDFNSASVSRTYDHSKDGKAASATMVMQIEYTEMFNPVIEDGLTGFDISVDMIDPFDPYNNENPSLPKTSGPDDTIDAYGRVDIE